MRLPTLPPSTPRLRETGWRSGARRLAFALVSAAIIVVVSERMFWFWASNPLSHVEVSAYYALAVAPALWLIDRFRVDRLAPLVLVALVFGMFVEGVLTPVTYTGGPFVPFFPVWFTAWHGLMGLVVAWYLVHRWLIERRVRALAVLATVAGAFWGLWSMTLWLPENVGDEELIADNGGPLTVLAPVAFARYALVFSLIFALAHWLWGRLGDVGQFRPSRPATILFGVVVAAMLIGWTVVVPWALPMFALYVWLAVRLLRRHEPVAKGPGLLAQLVGPVRARDLLSLAPMPIAATGTYALIWWLTPTDTVGRVVMYGTIVVQTAVAAVALWRSGREIGRRSAQSRSAASASNVPGVNSLS
ncbi:MAG: hypothetical protein AAFZ07_14350 [Actinomycetota bacterium]